MPDFIANLSVREKVTFSLAGLALLGLLIDSMVLEPYFQKQVSLTDQLDQAVIDLKWMESVVNRLPASQLTGETVKFEGSLAKLIDREVRDQKLDSNLAQMTPVGRDEIRLRFEGVAFNRLLNFIGRIYSQGLSVKDLRISAGDERARVDASLVFEKNV